MLGVTDNELSITPDEFVMIRDFIHEKSGIFFAENKMYLVKNRLQKRMTELNIKTVRDYFYHVKYDVSLKEFNCLMNLMTTNETSFYRNEPQLTCFADEVAPKLIEEKTKAPAGQRTIRIWSAGCSTGEEPYTLGILLLEKLNHVHGVTVEIIANDISEQVLSQARIGKYSGITLRNVAPQILARYFDQDGDNYSIKPAVKSLVKFSQANLNDPRQLASINNLDVVFCRNVMIYFSDEVKKQLVRSFFNSLRPGGFLYVGHSETLHGISKAFKLVYFKNALVYMKESKASEAAGTRKPALTTTPVARPAGSAKSGALKALDLLSKIKATSTTV